MKPHVITLKLQALDKQDKLLENIGTIPYSEIDNMVFLAIPKDSMDKDDKYIESLAKAAGSEGKTFVFVPPGTEVLKIVEKWEAQKD